LFRKILPAVIGLGLMMASLARAETIELVTYYPSSATTGDLHVTSLTVGTDYTGETPPDGVAAIYDKLWIGQGYTNPDRDPAALRVVGYPGARDKVLFLPGAERGSLNVGIGTANPAAGLHVIASSSGTLPTMILQDPDAAGQAAAEPYLSFRTSNGTEIGWVGDGSPTGDLTALVCIAGETRLTTESAQPITFHTNGTERMRVHSDGNVGIGTAAPAASAVVEMASTTQGFLPPRMTAAQRQAIAAPATGLVVYDTTVRGLMFYDGTQWQAVGGGGGAGVPIGTIVAWHKSATGTPALPAGWVECNGQRLNDAGSPYNGQTLPNLNTAAGYGGGRFLRGGTTSGAMQDGTLHLRISGHAPGLPWAYLPSQQANGQSDMDSSVGPVVPMNTFQAANTNTGWNQQVLFASRPVNMSVVWIMRVK